MLSGASFRPRALLATAALCSALILVPALPASATVICESDECDAGAWAAARGAANEASYWNMDPGHNCTNYVAWRLISAGVPQPRTHPGNATDWAFRAMLDGFAVNRNPAAGAVAQWDAGAGGNGPDGHVAYVEKVNDDGTILVSEDFWHGGDQLGPLTYRLVDPATVSNFIHYGATSTGLREVLSTPTGWHVRGTILSPEVTAMSAIRYDGTGAHVYYAEGGELREATALNGAWSAAPTGIPSTATAVAAVAMRDRPFVMSLEGDVLFMNVDTPSGWQRMRTGIEVTGDIAAVDAGGLLPTVFVTQGGVLYRVWNDHDGWHAENTGVEAWGPISAVVSANGWPEVFSVDGSLVFRAWQDADGWHEESTGVAATGPFAATTVEGVAALVVEQDGILQLVRTDGQSWTTTSLGVTAGDIITTLDVGLPAPMILQLG